MKIVSISHLVVFLFLVQSCAGQAHEKASQKGADPAQIKHILTQNDVQVGAERSAEYLHHLKGKNVAIVVNQTSMVKETHLVDYLVAEGVNIQTIFAPEHGFRGDADAGELLENGNDKKTGLPIVSLYGKLKKPTRAHLENVDVVIFDIQDVGARFYTYISTMHHMMQACGDNGIELIILDRPNPNGFYVDGPVLQEEFRSFVGMHEIPIVHGMTVGELAQMIVGEKWVVPAPKMTVVPVVGYQHSSTYELPVLPSPNLPNLRSILLYPSICFFEPTEYSVGRGTNAQFQLIGRPGNEVGDYEFTPEPKPGAKNPKHNGQVCRGYNLQDKSVEALMSMKKLDLSYILESLTHDKSNRITSTTFFDKLAGSDQLRQQLAKGMTESEIRASWEPALSDFKMKRAQYLMYP